MSAQQGHSPLPWDTALCEDEHLSLDTDVVSKPFGRPVASTAVGPLGLAASRLQAEANARMIVRAVNSHAALVAALEKSAALLAFMHGAFKPRLRPEDLLRVTEAHMTNRAALAAAKSP